jgi:hypothetical protein
MATELTTAHQLLSKAIERQAIGATAALDVLLREQTATGVPDIAYVAGGSCSGPTQTLPSRRCAGFCRTTQSEAPAVAPPRRAANEGVAGYCRRKTRRASGLRFRPPAMERSFQWSPGSSSTEPRKYRNSLDIGATEGRVRP